MSIIANGTRVVDKQVGGYSAGTGTVVGHTPGVPYPYAIQFDGADCVFTRTRDEFTVAGGPTPVKTDYKVGDKVRFVGNWPEASTYRQYSGQVGVITYLHPGALYPVRARLLTDTAIGSLFEYGEVTPEHSKPLMQTIREGASGWLDEHCITHEHAEQLFRYIEAAIDYDEENS